MQLAINTRDIIEFKVTRNKYRISMVRRKFPLQKGVNPGKNKFPIKSQKHTLFIIK